MSSDLREQVKRLRALLDTLRAQGITNLRQLWAWLRSVDVTTEIVAYMRAHPGLQGLIYWVAAFAVGLVAVGYAWLFHDLSLVAQRTADANPHYLFLLTPACFLFSWWMVRKFAPGAAGSGIPQLMAALEVEPHRASSWVGARVAIVMVFSSLAMALGGGVVGREGPTIQIAGAIFYTLGMYFRPIWPSLSHHSLLVAGGSAGIAAAFNTPLGGIVFAVEELSQQHFNRFKTFLISAVIVSGLVAQWILGPYLFLGYPNLAVVSNTALFWAVAVGVVCGILGAYFGKILGFLFGRMSRLGFHNQWKLALAAGLVIGCGGWAFGSEMLGGGTDLMTRILFDQTHEVTWPVLLGRYFGPLVSYTAGGTGGIFAPALAAGAAVGAKMQELIGTSFPNLMVLMGMAAFLSAMTRAPFTAFVLVLEMTDRHSAIFALMVASLLASLVAKLVDAKSFYEIRCAAYLEKEKTENTTSPHSPGGASEAKQVQGPSPTSSEPS